MALVPISSYGAVLSPKTSKRFEKEALGDEEKGAGAPPPTYGAGLEPLETIPHTIDGHKVNKLPLQVLTHYARIQREFELNNDTDRLYEIQDEQMRTDPHANLSPEKLEAQRKIRAAKIYSVFFLITTDILGPSNAPYAMSTLGYVGGVILYIVFGLMAALGGYMLNRAYGKLDSNNYPIRTFADLAARCVGAWFRYPVALLQFIQMIMNVGLILLGTASSVSQLSAYYHGGVDHFCFTVDILVWALLGMIVGQIKTLHRFAHIANSAVWMNIAICIIVMVAAATMPPYFKFIHNNFGFDYPYNVDVVFKKAIMSGDLSQKIAGMNNMVFAWGGATIFAEVMAELKKPMDFWKGMIYAQGLILVVYLFFGLFVYSYWGQWVYPTANLGIPPGGLENAANILSVISGLIAAILYGNVGLKVLYQGFLVSDFHFPSITTTKGTLYWGIGVFLYWAIAFVIGTAIPSISTLVGIIGAFCILNFSYTFPFLFNLTLLLREDAGSRDTFDLQTLKVTRGDTWFQLSRWKRAITLGGRDRTLYKVGLFLLTLGALVTCGICSYSAIEGAIEAYSVNVATSFGCKSNTN